MKKTLSGVLCAIGFVLMLMASGQIIISVSFETELIIRTVLICGAAVSMHLARWTLEKHYKEARHEVPKMQEMDETGRKTAAHQKRGCLSI